MALITLLFLTGISGGFCQLGEGEVYPLFTSGSGMGTLNKCAWRNERRIICGWPGISDGECEQLGCCSDSRGSLRCFRYSQMNKPPLRSTTHPSPPFSNPSASNQAPDISIPISQDNPPQHSLHQGAHLSSVSSDISYSGCLLHCTSLLIEERRICLYDARKDRCLHVGCCFDETTNQCFHSNGVKDSCPTSAECQVTLSPVLTCGDFSKTVCEAIGCCHNNISGNPTCYRKQAVGRGDTASTASPPPATTTVSFSEELKKFQDLFNSGQLASLLPGNAGAAAAVTQASTTIPTTTTAAAVTAATTDLLDQLQQIEQLLAAGVLPTLIPANQTRATTPKGPPVTTLPPKTAPLVQKWKPTTLYDRRCDRNGYCRYVIRSCLPKKCGDPPYNPKTVKIPNFDPRKIVGGSRAFPHAHPWTVMIQKTEGNRTFVCGGSIICNKWIVTAAHCLDKQDGNTNEPDLNPDLYKLFFGRWRGLRSYYGLQVQIRKGRRDIEALIQHEKFIPGKHRGVITHDIAMIKLRIPVIFNSYVHPVCLPRERAIAGQVMFATGWGITRGIGPAATTLKQLGVEIKPRLSCTNRVPGFRNPPGVLCAGGEPNQDTCTGDSGGPLVGSKLSIAGKYSQKAKNIFHLYGLTSIGSPSCNTRQYDRQPALYTDVHYYLPWIRRNTADCCS